MAYPIQTFQMTSEHDGLKLSCFSIVPESPRGVVQMVHGMCEYKERYLPLAQYLADKGFCVVMHDHRGHGKSVRTHDDLGYFYGDGASGCVQDVYLVSNYCKQTFPQLPLFMFAHSMGTLAARAYLTQYDGMLDGLILCGSPSKNPAAGAGRVLLRILSFFQGDRARNNFAAGIFSDTFNKPFMQEGKNAWICSDAEVVERYNLDPLCNYIFTLNGYSALLELMRRAYAPVQAQNPALPVRFIAGQFDPCIIDETHFAQAVELLQKRGYHSVTSRIFPDMRHEIHNEKEHLQVFCDIEKTLCGWLHLAGRSKKV